VNGKRFDAMTNVFISYRRDDTSGHAGRLSDRLVAGLGAERVFMDVNDIQPGEDFAHAIERTLARCSHLLAVIGPRWLSSLEARQATGEDFVRSEIGTALSRGTTVIPVLVGGAKMPSAAQLPADLAALARCQAVIVEDRSFDDDAGRLVRFLAEGARASAVPILGRHVSRRTLSASLGLGAVALAGMWWLWPARAPGRPMGGVVEPPALETPSTARPVVAEPDIDGAWIAELKKAGQPPYRIRLRLARSGTQVIGAVTYPTGEATIRDGQYVNGRMTFHTSHVPQFESTPATIRFQAQVDGDVIRLTTADDGGVATGEARRETPATSR
jgi:hypothetical protein